MNFLYRDFPTGAIAPNDVFTITGHALALRLRGLKPHQRAAVAAMEVDDGGIYLTAPTDKQVADLYHVSVSTLRTARSLTPKQRSLVMKGKRALSTSHDAIGHNRVMAVFDLLTMPTAAE